MCDSWVIIEVTVNQRVDSFHDRLFICEGMSFPRCSSARGSECQTSLASFLDTVVQGRCDLKKTAITWLCNHICWSLWTRAVYVLYLYELQSMGPLVFKPCNCIICYKIMERSNTQCQSMMHITKIFHHIAFWHNVILQDFCFGFVYCRHNN